ncbi:MAG: hypothetical protein ACTSV6_08800 [Candidatus Heimdallarchaeota archaeon]
MGKKEEKETVTIEQLKILFKAIRDLASVINVSAMETASCENCEICKKAMVWVLRALAIITGDDNDIDLGRNLARELKFIPDNWYRVDILLKHAEIFKTPSAIRKARKAMEKIHHNDPRHLISLAKLTKNRNDISKARKAVLSLNNEAQGILLMELAKISKNADDVKLAVKAIYKIDDYNYIRREFFLRELLNELKKNENSINKGKRKKTT